ncbi:Astra associated protein 1 Asa1 [Paecilomyces lecythidis]|uniref:ASTRA-associated protein 1 n=1 Tax=Paecilomyces lecythidis TaxID=3004212 RepID=A0ABR3WY13_9EURO
MAATPGSGKTTESRTGAMSSQPSQQKGLLPPASPAYVLRGHAAPIHALNFFAHNEHLLSGDADGWVVIWSLVTKRPIAVWKAHEGAILEAKGFYYEESREMEIFTHGRDHKLRVWKTNPRDGKLLDRTLPVDLKQGSQPETGLKPWLLHSLAVNALNFCAFALCSLPGYLEHNPAIVLSSAETASFQENTQQTSPQRNPQGPLLIAVPNALNSGNIDIFHLPSEHRVSTIAGDTTKETGMVMAVNLYFALNQDLYVISAYEDGQAMVHVRRGPAEPGDYDGHVPSTPWKWQKIYASRAHSQPILSLDVSPSKDFFLTSGADPLVIKHPIPTEIPTHLSKSDMVPIKVVNDHHAGKQGLKIRSDGKLYATAGWDARVRVYTCKSMKEMACLKWHKEGCFVVAWANIYSDASNFTSQADPMTLTKVPEPQPSSYNVIPEPSNRSLLAIRTQRLQKAQLTHWLAAGSKDGKISLWDIY